MAEDPLGLAELHRRLQQMERPPGDTGPSWPLLHGAAARASWRTAGLLRRSHPAVWGLFGSQQEVRNTIADLLDEAGPLSEDDLLTGLREQASGEWVVTAPLVNMRPPLVPVEIDPGRLLVATVDGDLDHRRPAREFFGTADLRVGDRLQHDSDDVLRDTRHTASLLDEHVDPAPDDVQVSHVTAWRARRRPRVASSTEDARRNTR